jgi:hypothetical protein
MARLGQSRDAIPRGWISLLEAAREHGLSSLSRALLRRLACGEQPRLRVRRFGRILCLQTAYLEELKRRLAAWRAGVHPPRRRAVRDLSRRPRDPRGRWVPVGRVPERDRHGPGPPVGEG